jgi:arylsulfatase A-like enzyme
VVFLADHGESLGDHNLYFHHGMFPYDACTRVPLLLRFPGIPPGVVEEPVALLDLVPTLLELLELEPGWQCEGRSFAARLRNPSAAPVDRPVFTGSGYKKLYTVAARVGRYKLIKVTDRVLAARLTGEPYELYDVVADPGETRNLRAELPEVTEELRRLLDPWVEEAYATVPFPTDEGAALSDFESRRLLELGYVDGE